MRFQFLGGRRSGRLPSVLREHLSGSRMLLSSLRGFTKWIQRSADPRSNDMKIQGGKGKKGAESCQISPKEHYGDIISNVGRYRWEGGGGEKEICVEGCIRLIKVCGGCNVQ